MTTPPCKHCGGETINGIDERDAHANPYICIRYLNDRATTAEEDVKRLNRRKAEAEAATRYWYTEVERLRAQSTGEWRNPPTSPENDEWFEVRVRVRYLPDQNCYKTNFGDEIGIDAFEGWRPAPPQE